MIWLKTDEPDSGRREDFLTSSERTEHALILRQNKRLKLEEILSRPRPGDRVRPGSLAKQILFQRSLPIR